MLVVQLDDPRFGAGPATVVAVVDSVRDFLTLTTDRDGARDRRFRLWRGDHPIGTRVAAASDF